MSLFSIRAKEEEGKWDFLPSGMKSVFVKTYLHENERR